MGVITEERVGRKKVQQPKAVLYKRKCDARWGGRGQRGRLGGWVSLDSLQNQVTIASTEDISEFKMFN